MKKTSKTPENIEVTPNKKKLKQARLPFMLLSDVSPKAETPPSRKRKLSVSDAVPVPKVGKLSKENGLSEELVVISDEDSKDLLSPKKQDKLPNPYVKLVDTARKKKLQKSKGQKKSKNRLTKHQTSESSEQQFQNVNTDNVECEDIEMVEVEALVHQDCDKEKDKSDNSVPYGELVAQKDEDNLKTNENSNDSKKKTPVGTPAKPAKKPKASPKSKQIRKLSKNSKVTKPTNIISETICLDDSNNSADVQMPKAAITEQVTEKSEEKESDPTEQSHTPSINQSNSKESPANKNTVSKKKPQQNDATPKRSSRIKMSESQNKAEIKLQADSEGKDNPTANKESNNASKKEVNQIGEPKEEEDSDIEMLEPEEKINEHGQGSPKKSENKDLEEPSTPKRSSRNKTKDTDTNLDVSTCSMLDESVTSNPSTPKQADHKSLNESLQNLTPKQMAKRLEAIKRREEKEKEKQEREKKRQEEKEERAKQRQEKEDQKKREREEKEDARKKEREEKEEQKRKEREEKEKQKEIERKVREEKEEAKKKEREEKEEQRKKEKEAKEEERRKKQEALELEKQEQELKLKKTKEAFVNFFVPKQKVEKDSTPSDAPVSKSSMLSSFTVKVDMRLAPTCRVGLDVERKDALEKLMQDQNSSGNYLTCLKNGEAKPGSCGKTWPLDERDDDDDVMIVEDELPPIDGAGEVIACEQAPREKLRPKLLSFHENRRPPYWGTWRRRSARVGPRRPFGQEKQVDYEVDSDDDWEDEGDGESLDGSAGGSDDDAGADDYEVDHELFVPHGYLSDEEATMDEEDDVLSLSPETQKARLKHLEDEFESELKKPTEKLKPRLYGPLWETPAGAKPDQCVDALWHYFHKFAMVMEDVTLLLQPAPEPEKETDKKKVKKKKAQVEGEGSEHSPKNKKKKEAKAENKEGKKSKQEIKKTLPNQLGINTFLKKLNTT